MINKFKSTIFIISLFVMILLIKYYFIKVQTTNNQRQQIEVITNAFPITDKKKNDKGYIIYNSLNDLFYFFQSNRWNYEKTPIWGMVQEVKGELATQDLLAKINIFNMQNRSLEVASDSVSNQLAISDGVIYYLLAGKIQCLSNNTDIPLFELNNNEIIKEFDVRNNIVYFTIYNKDGLWKKEIEGNKQHEIVIKDKLTDFQIFDEEIYYLNEKGINKFHEFNEKNILYRSDIVSFEINSILVYLVESGNLYIHNEEKVIAEKVSSFCISENKIYYNSENKIYSYDIFSFKTELLYTIINNANLTQVHSLKKYDDKLIIEIGMQWYHPEILTNINIFDLNKKTMEPILEIDSHKKQQYLCKELRYSLMYPIGFIIQYDPGSYLSAYTSFTNPNNGLFFRVTNYEIFNGEIKTEDLKGNVIKNNEEILGCYELKNIDGEFEISCNTLDGFQFIVNGKEENIKEGLSILFDMVKSLKTW